MTRSEVLARHIKDNEAMAKKAFAKHVIKVRHKSPCGQFASWRCQKPDSWNYGFDISIEPGRLMVFGDIGTLVLQRTTDMLAWSRGSIDSIGYFAEKVVQEIETEEFSEEMARAWIDEETADVAEQDRFAKKRWPEVREELLTALEDGKHAFEEALHQSRWVDGSDWPSFETYKPGFLWCRQAVKWFLENVEGE